MSNTHPLPILLACLLAFTAPARAALFLVGDTNDTLKSTSLRGAILAANELGGRNTILLGLPLSHQRGAPQPWVYRLTLAGADETRDQSGDLDIRRGNLTIMGMSSNVTIDATGLGDRIFQVFPQAQLTLVNLLLTGGTAPGNGYAVYRDGEAGGAIYNAGTVVLRRCILTNNASGAGNVLMGNAGGTQGGGGGGIYNAGILFARSCTIAGNWAGAGIDGATGGAGGAIRNDSLCALTDCVLSGNQSGVGGSPSGNFNGAGGSGGPGGGIFNSGTMLLTRCSVGENTAGDGASGGAPLGLLIPGFAGGPAGAGGSGGGIYNAGHMQLNRCSVFSNQSGRGGHGGDAYIGGSAGGGGQGAGVLNSGTLHLVASTLSGNTCGDGGAGGGGRYGAAGAAGGSGGGLYNAGWVRVLACTLALNQTGGGGNGGSGVVPVPPSSGGSGGFGGGILNESNSVGAFVGDTLVALNSLSVGGAGGTNTSTPGWQPTVELGAAGTNGYGPDAAGEFTSWGFNLLGIADGSVESTNSIHADQVGSLAEPLDPLLGPLQMNGGLTPTHALLPGSPALDQGRAFGLHTDQRGQHRPTRQPSTLKASGGDATDIGAFEAGTP